MTTTHYTPADSLPLLRIQLAEDEPPAHPPTKKEQILDMHARGVTNVAELARELGVKPSYVAGVLQKAGRLQGYFDLYTTTALDQNIYARFFRNALSFKTLEAARESVAKIDRLYNYFERLGDRAGQHQAMIVALTGKNRARWSGKHSEAAVFAEWLASH
jgi:transposase-like protein